MNDYNKTVQKISEGKRAHMGQLGNAVMMANGGKTIGSLNPEWVEWLMGVPVGWTDLKRSETGKSVCVRILSGELSWTLKE